MFSQTCWEFKCLTPGIVRRLLCAFSVCTIKTRNNEDKGLNKFEHRGAKQSFKAAKHRRKAVLGWVWWHSPPENT